MAIAQDTSVAWSTSIGVTSATFAHTCTGSNLLLLVAVRDNLDNVTGVTYNGVAMTSLKKDAAGTGTGIISLWGLLNPATGTNNVIVSVGASATLDTASVSYTGVAQTGLPDATGSNETNSVGSGTFFGASVTTVADNCWYTMMIGKTFTEVPTAASACANVQTAAGLGLFDSNGVAHPAGTFAPRSKFTGGSQNTVSITVSFAPVTGSTSPSVSPSISPSSSISPSVSPSTSISPSSSISPSISPSVSVSPSISPSSSISPSTSVSPSVSPSSSISPSISPSSSVSPSAATGTMDTVIIGNNTSGTTAATDVIYNFYGVASGSGTPPSNGFLNVMPIAGTLSKFYLSCDAGPGAGLSRTFTVYKNGTDTGLTITLSGAGTGAGVNSGSDVTHTVNFVATDTLSIHTSATGTTTSPGTIRWSMASTSNVNTSMVLSNSGANLTAAATNYVPIQGKGLNATATNEQTVMPTAGTFLNAYGILSNAPASGKNYVATLYQNGSPTSIVLTFTGSSQTTANDTSHTVTVAAGDTFYWSVAVDSGATPSSLAISLEFDPTINGESVHTYASSVATTNSANRFQAITAPNAASYQSSESTRQAYTIAAVWKKLFVNQITAPGGSASYQYQFSLNSTPGNPTVTISASATTGSDTTNTVTATDGQSISLKLIPTSTPASTILGWGIVSYISPAGSTSPSVSPSISPSSSISPSISPSTSISPSVSPSVSASPSLSPSVSASPSASPSAPPSNDTSEILCTDGITGYAEVPDDDSLSVTTTGALTISVWLKPKTLDNTVTSSSADGEYVHWLGKGQYGSPNTVEYSFRMYNLTGGTRPNRISFYIFNSTGGIGDGSYFEGGINNCPPLVANEWIHVVGKIDATSTYIYRNGVLMDTDVYTADITPTNTTAPFRIGHVEDGSDPGYINASFDDLRFYNTALSDQAISNLYNAGRSGLETITPTHHWRFDDGNGITAVDDISGLNATLHSGSVFCIDDSSLRQYITLVAAESDWFIKRSGLRQDAPLNEHKMRYWISKGFIPFGKSHLEVEKAWLRSVSGSRSDNYAELWRQAVSSQGLVPFNALNANKFAFYTSVISNP